MNEPTCFFYGHESTKRGEAVSASAKRKRKKASGKKRREKKAFGTKNDGS
jgi:hypothetical protein